MNSNLKQWLAREAQTTGEPHWRQRECSQVGRRTIGFLLLFALPVVLPVLPASANPQSPQLEQAQQRGPRQRPSEAFESTYRYQCDGDASFVVNYGEERARLLLGRQTIRLPQVRSGSGVQYSDGTTTLFTKGNEASLEVNQVQTHSNCVGEVVEAATPAPMPPHRRAMPAPHHRAPMPPMAPPPVQAAPAAPVPPPEAAPPARQPAPALAPTPTAQPIDEPEPTVRGMW